MTSKPTAQPRAHRRSRKQRLAAGAVLASTTLLGTYLAAGRPQPTYASPNKGGAGQGQDRDPSGRSFGTPFVAPRSAPTCGGATPVGTELALASAITNAQDGDTICIAGPIELTAPLPTIDDTRLTLVGDGNGDDTITVSADDSAIVGSLLTAELTADDTLTIANLGFQGGRAQGDPNRGNDAYGGAVDVSGGALVVHDSTFADNRAAPSAGGGLGGAVAVDGSAFIYGSVFSNNAVPSGTSSYAGGAVWVKGSLTVADGSSFTGNSGNRGGAIYTRNGPISVSDSNFRGNTATGPGGAISVQNFYGVMPIADSIFQDNISAGNGGAVATYSSVDITGASSFIDNEANRGGGLYVYYGGAITGAAFAGNQATSKGGAIYSGRTGFASKTLSIDSSMFTSNEAKYGGAIHWYGSDDTIAIADSSFNSNLAVNSGDGGALALKHDSSTALAQIESSSFTGNSSEDDGGAIRLSGPVQMSVRDSSLTGNSSTGTGSGAGGAISMGGSSSGTLTNTFVGGNYAEYGTGGIYVSGGALSLIFSTVYDDSVADVTYPSSLYVLGYGSLTAIGSVVGSSSNLPVIELAPQATIDDTYLVVAGPAVSLVGPGSRSVAAGTLQLGNLDNTSTPGQGGRSPASTSVLVSGAATSDLRTGVTKDQLNVDRGTVADPTWTIGARQVAAGSTPTPTPTPTPVFPPSPPTNVTAVPSDRSAVVSWAAPASAGSFPVSTYKATASPGGQSCLVVAPALTCTVAGLANGTPYTFTVQALSGGGWSSASAPSNVVRPGGETPAPEPQPLPEALAPGEALLQVNGVPDPNVTVEPNASESGLQVNGDGWSMALDGLGPDGKPLNLGPDGELRLQDERDVVTEGTGFLPNSEVDLYVDPPVLVTGAVARASTEAIYVGTVRTDASGNFAGTATLPEDIAPGDHVLQATGYSPGRQARAMSLGVVVEPSLVLDKGTRKADGRHDRIRTTGSSTGIEAGTRLTPWIRYNGQTSFAQGKATITVQSDGTFRWTRQIRKDKGITAYVSYVDTRSNEVFWAKVR